MSLVIRPIQKEDAVALAKIEEELFSEPWSEKEFRDLCDRDYCHYLVAEADGTVAGCVGMTLIAGEADVDKVMVAKENQGKHICEELMEHLFAWGRELSVEAYTLEVRVSNAVAIHIYEKNGFVSEGIRPNFYRKPTEDAQIMWKRLM